MFRNFPTKEAPGQYQFLFLSHLVRSRMNFVRRGTIREGRLFCTTMKAKNGNPLVSLKGQRFYARTYENLLQSNQEHRSPPFPDDAPFAFSGFPFISLPANSTKRDKDPLGAVKIFHVGSPAFRSTVHLASRNRFTAGLIRSDKCKCGKRVKRYGARVIYALSKSDERSLYTLQLSREFDRGVDEVDSWHRQGSRDRARRYNEEFPGWILKHVEKKDVKRSRWNNTRETVFETEYLASRNGTQKQAHRCFSNSELRMLHGGKFKSLPDCDGTLEIRILWIIQYRWRIPHCSVYWVTRKLSKYSKNTLSCHFQSTTGPAYLQNTIVLPFLPPRYSSDCFFHLNDTVRLSDWFKEGVISIVRIMRYREE